MSLRTLNFGIKGYFNFTLNGWNKNSKNFKPLSDTIPSSNTPASILITGSNSGIGLAAAEHLASKNATIHMACRSLERAENAKNDILQKNQNAKIVLHQLDVSKLETIDKFVANFLTTHKIDILINNAGCMVHGTDKDKRHNAQGYEINCATNLLGTYILTKSFLERSSSKIDKVITVSSGGMYTVNLDPEYGFKKNWENIPSDAAQVYAFNKRSQVVFMNELSNEYENTFFGTMHPGWAETEAVKNALPEMHRRLQGNWRSPAQGADTINYLCHKQLDENVMKKENGKFWFDRSIAEENVTFSIVGSSNSKTNRTKLMSNLNSVYNEFKIL